jgi:hypothetical protein
MIDALHDYKPSSPMDQWPLALDPLHQQFQGWNAGDASHLEMDEAIHKTHKACQKVYGLCTTKRDFLVSAIQFNEDWFPGWEKDHPRPRDLYCRTYLRL